MMNSLLQVKPLKPDLGWGVVVEADLNQLQNSDLQNIIKLLSRELVVLFRQQKLKPHKEASLCHIFGEVEIMPPEVSYRCPMGSDGQPILEIQRVTGQKDNQGRELGLFGHNETLDWHANRASFIEGRKSVVWLYSVRGSTGSRTSWCNTQKAFEDLSESTKKDLRKMKAFYGFMPGRYTPVNGFKSHVNPTPTPIVRFSQHTGREGLYFPFLQMFGIEGMSENSFQEFIEMIKKHILQDQYIYHHDWQDGDVLLSDQWFSIHKRWPCDVSERLLHRITFNYPEALRPIAKSDLANLE